MTGFPSVDVRSYGAGGGSIASVDRGGLLRVGPESAGADPGPAAYGRGGSRPTFTDAAVVLGWIDPRDFLGGSIELDANAARAALAGGVGEPLGLDAVEAAAAVALVTTEQMVRAIEDATLRQGLDPAAAPLVAGGGAAGLNAVAIARRLGCADVLVPDVSAALSAAGALVSDVAKDFAITHPTWTSRFDHAGVARVLDELRARAAAFLDGVAPPGAPTGVDLFAEAHYAREVWEIEVPLEDGVADAAAVERLRRVFHARHDELYAVSDPDAVVEVISLAGARVVPHARRRGTRGRPGARRACADRTATRLVRARRLGRVAGPRPRGAARRRARRRPGDRHVARDDYRRRPRHRPRPDAERLPPRTGRLTARARPRRAGHDRVREFADPARRDGDGVAGLEEARRIHERAAARRGAGHQAVARLERDDRAEPLDPHRWRADLLADQRGLALLAVDERLDPDVLPVGQLVVVTMHGPIGQNVSKFLPRSRLPVVELHRARADVVEDGVAEDVVERVLGARRSSRACP